MSKESLSIASYPLEESNNIESYLAIKSSLESKINDCKIKVDIINRYLSNELNEIDEYEQSILDGKTPPKTTREEYYNEWSDIEDDVLSVNTDFDEGPIIIDIPITLDNISSSTNHMSLISNEILALMLESKSRSRKAFKNAHSPNYNPMLIHQGNSLAFIKMLKNISKDQEFHYDLIIRNNNIHCSALQIHCDGNGEVNLYYADAAGDYSNLILVNNIVKALNGTLFANYKTGTQKASRGCTIFSIQDLNSLSKLNKIELELLPNENFNPMLLKNSQSYTLINDYLKKPKASSPVSKGKDLSEIVEEFSITGIDLKTDERKKKNFRIIFKEYKYLKSALSVLNQAYLEGGEIKIQEIINKRWAKLELSKIYTKMNFSAAQISEVDGIYDPRQIDLVINHKLPKNLFIKSEWFKNEETADAAYNYIISREPSDLENKINRAKEVEKFTTKEMIEMLDNFGLEPQKMLNSTYFECEQTDQNLKPKVLSSLHFIYNNTPGSISNKKQATKEFFNSIFQHSYASQISAIVDYKLDASLVKKAKCFKYGNENIALKWIKQAYNDHSLSSITEKENAAKIAFMQIKDIINLKEVNIISSNLATLSSAKDDNYNTTALEAFSPSLTNLTLRKIPSK
jgi:hypothetical protein